MHIDLVWNQNMNPSDLLSVYMRNDISPETLSFVQSLVQAVDKLHIPYT